MAPTPTPGEIDNISLEDLNPISSYHKEETDPLESYFAGIMVIIFVALLIFLFFRQF